MPTNWRHIPYFSFSNIFVIMSASFSFVWLSSFKNLFIHNVSLQASVTAIYSASVIESTTYFWNFDCENTTSFAKVTRYPDVDFSVSNSRTSLCDPAPKYKTSFCRPFEIPHDPFIAAQWSFQELAINLFTTPTACAMSSLVHTMKGIKLPTLEHMKSPSLPPLFQLRGTLVNSIWNDLQEENQLS